MLLENPALLAEYLFLGAMVTLWVAIIGCLVGATFTACLEIKQYYRRKDALSRSRLSK